MDVQQLTEDLFERLFIPLEASGRHVHLTDRQIHTLFGHSLTPHRPLSQPGQFLAKERVCLRGPKGAINQVAVLGPARKEGQVEISLTDSRLLGLEPPIRQSGDVEDSPGITLFGPMGSLDLPRGVIIAQRHLHLTPEDAGRFGVTDGQRVRLEVFTRRPLVFEDVVARVSPKFSCAAHLDYDEANACAMVSGDFGRIVP